MIPPYHLWVYIQENWKQGLKERGICIPSSQQHDQQRSKVEATQMSSTDKWIKKLCTDIIEYYSVLQEKGILTHASTWVNLEGIALSEIKQS